MAYRRIFPAAILALALCAPAAAAPQDDQKRIEDLEKKVAELAQRVKELEEVLGQMKMIMTQGMAGMAASQVAANERNASSSLKTLASAEADFRANDRDENRVNDFWVGDVSGLYRCLSGREQIKLIERSVAAADAAPLKSKELADIEAEKPVPKAGYLFVALKRCFEDGKPIPYNEGGHRNNSMFGFAAYPADYPKSGRFTFIINENNTVLRKDTKGVAPEAFPENPAREGWSKLD